MEIDVCRRQPTFPDEARDRGQQLALRRVVARHITPGSQGVQRLERGRRAQRRVGAAVHELQQLDAELDVAQTARAELELTGGLPVGHVLLDPPAHRLDVLDEVVAAGGAPHEGGDRALVGLAQLEVPRRHPGLEQRLELPGLGPPLVVGAVAGHRAHQRAGLALGAQRRVDRPQRALAGGCGAGAHRRGRQQRTDPQRLVLVGPVGRLGDEDDVDVGDVVELAAAGLAHADDRQPALLVSGPVPLPGDRQGRLQRRLGELRE